MSTTAPPAQQAGSPAPASGPGARGLAAGLARAAAAPLACGLVLIALLAAWVISGGGGTISRVRIQVTRATVPMISFTAAGAAGRNAPAFLTIRNPTGTDDILVAASSPAAPRVLLTGPDGRSAAGGAGLAIPAGATVSLSPFGTDLVLVRPGFLRAGQQVVLRLRFREAGTVTVQAEVTAPGSP